MAPPLFLAFIGEIQGKARHRDDLHTRHSIHLRAVIRRLCGDGTTAITDSAMLGRALARQNDDDLLKGELMQKKQSFSPLNTVVDEHGVYVDADALSERLACALARADPPMATSTAELPEDSELFDAMIAEYENEDNDPDP